MKYGRNTAGQFTANNSGRPKGSRNKATIAIESLLQGQAEALTQTSVSEGQLTPIEATRVMELIDSYRRTLELTEIEERLRALEAI